MIEIVNCGRYLQVIGRSNAIGQLYIDGHNRGKWNGQGPGIQFEATEKLGNYLATCPYVFVVDPYVIAISTLMKGKYKTITIEAFTQVDNKWLHRYINNIEDLKDFWLSLPMVTEEWYQNQVDRNGSSLWDLTGPLESTIFDALYHYPEDLLVKALRKLKEWLPYD